VGHVPESALGRHRGHGLLKVEVMTLIGPVRYSVLVVMDLKTRHVEVAGIVREAYDPFPPSISLVDFSRRGSLAP
jgi:hypothetical protein